MWRLAEWGEVMTKSKAIRIINAIIRMKVGNKYNIDRYRWNDKMKEEARRMVQEDIDALRMAKDALK